MMAQMIRNTLSKRLYELYIYWSNSIGEGHELPYRSSFDPVDIPRLLSMLILAEILPDDSKQMDFRIRFRLVGTDAVNYWGKDVTGQYLDEVLGGNYLDYLCKQYRQVVETKRPLYAHYLLRWEDYKVSNPSRLYLPFTREGKNGAVTDIIVGQIIRNDARMTKRPLIEALDSLRVMEIEQKIF